MAILTDFQHAELRRAYFDAITANITKGQARLVAQAIENWWESVAVRNALSTAIDATGVVLTAAEKRRFVRMWLRQRFDRGN